MIVFLSRTSELCIWVFDAAGLLENHAFYSFISLLFQRVDRSCFSSLRLIERPFFSSPHQHLLNFSPLHHSRDSTRDANIKSGKSALLLRRDRTNLIIASLLLLLLPSHPSPPPFSNFLSFFRPLSAADLLPSESQTFSLSLSSSVDRNRTSS